MKSSCIFLYIFHLYHFVLLSNWFHYLYPPKPFIKLFYCFLFYSKFLIVLSCFLIVSFFLKKNKPYSSLMEEYLFLWLWAHTFNVSFLLSPALSLFLQFFFSCFDFGVVLFHLSYSFYVMFILSMLESFLKRLVILCCPLMNQTLNRWLKSLCVGLKQEDYQLGGFTVELSDSELFHLESLKWQCVNSSL